MSALPHLRRPAVALAALTGLALLAPAAWSAPQPTPGQASFKLKQAFCGYEPATDKIKAKGAITATVKQLPADEFFYLKARLTIDGKKPGGDWKPVGVHRTSSIGFGPDELPFRWRTFVSLAVPDQVADHQVLSLRYRVKLIQEQPGKDAVVWQQSGRSSSFECGDG